LQKSRLSKLLLQNNNNGSLNANYGWLGSKQKYFRNIKTLTKALDKSTM
jgi:hypothetical protein